MSFNLICPDGRRLSFPAPMRYRGGLGALSTTDQLIANAAGSTAVAVGSAVGGPLGGAIAGSIAQIGILLANVFAGCGSTCTEAANLANNAEPLLQENLDTYMSAPVHYQSLQTAALANFNNTWNALVQACSNPALGSAGQNCITARQNGACHYQTSPGGWQGDTSVNPGVQGSGSACWNWFVGYYDPIANDPTVVPDPVPGAADVTSLLSSVGVSTNATLFGLPVVDVAMGVGLLLLAALFL